MRGRQLFSGTDLRNYLQGWVEEALREIGRAASSDLDDTTLDEFASQAHVEPLVMSREKVRRSSITEIQMQGNGTNHPNPVPVEGLRVSFWIPFEGDAQLWLCSPNLRGPLFPEAVILDEHLEIEVSGPRDRMSKDGLQDALKERLDQFDPWIKATNKQVDEHNESLLSHVERAVGRRRDQLAELDELEDGLDIPVDRRPPGPSTNW